MKRVISLLLSLVLIWAAATHSLRRSLDAQAPQKTERARGYVFHDRNGNGRRDSGEPGLADVRVSNGRTITTTDAVDSCARDVSSFGAADARDSCAITAEGIGARSIEYLRTGFRRSATRGGETDM